MKEYEGLNGSFEYKGVQVYATSDFDGLPEETKLILEPQLASVAAIGFQRPLTPEFRQDVGNHLRGGDLYVIADGVTVRGFGLLQSFPELRTAYISGIVKSPQSPSRVMEAIVSRYMDENRVKTVAVRTQNDRVAEIMANTCSRVVSMDQPSSSRELELLASMELLPGENLDSSNLIARGYYGGPMIGSGDRRRSNNRRVTNLTDKLDYFGGDALLLVGYR